MNAPLPVSSGAAQHSAHALVAANAFNAQLATTGVNPAAIAAAAHAKALVESRYIVAMQRPRDWDTVREKLLKECRRPRFAAVARYRKPIGRDESKWPTGPSIRFAEAAVRAMTNLTVDTTTTYDDEQRRILHVEVVDLESNVPYAQDISIIKTIERRQTKEGDMVLGTRTNSYGDKLYILQGTDDDVQNKQNALVSKALRTQALRLLPGDILDECMDTCVETIAREDAQDPDAARRQIFDAFGAIGVRAEQLKDYLGSDGASLTPSQLADLRALYSAIKDGEATWRDVMDARSGGGTDGAGPGKKKGVTLEELKARKAAAKAGKKGDSPAEARFGADDRTAAQTSPASAGAPDPGPAPAGPSYEQLEEAMRKAPDRDAADQVLDSGRHLDDKQREDLARLYEERFPD